MRKSGMLALLLLCMLILGACSLNSDAASLYKQESPLQVKMNVPEDLSVNEEVVLEVSLSQNGAPVDSADFVHFEVQKQDGSIRFPMEEAENTENGVYQMHFKFKSEGLYYFEVHAGNKGSVVSPQQQFIVGELSDSELESLKQGSKPEQGSSGHHH